MARQIVHDLNIVRSDKYYTLEYNTREFRFGNMLSPFWATKDESLFASIEKWNVVGGYSLKIWTRDYLTRYIDTDRQVRIADRDKQLQQERAKKEERRENAEKQLKDF